jgi:predicted nucleotidyltransferase
MMPSSPWKIDKARFEVISDFDKIAKKIGINYLLVGATARDLINNSIGISSSRMTRDIDLAILVSTWNKFNELSSAMIASGKFRNDKAPRHRHFHISTGIPLDILPFGAIDGDDHVLRWPDPDHTSMSTLGFEEAYKSAIEAKISINPDTTIKITSRPGFAIMKLIAWNDHREGYARDAQDLLHLLHNYLDSANIQRLYGNHSDIAEAGDFDFECAGARLLGRDMASIAGQQTLLEISLILSIESSDDSDFKLINDMTSSEVGREYQFGQVLRLVRSLKEGVHDIHKL